jgi:hypothetical protein
MDQTAREDYDSPWKDVIERFFELFMAFYFPCAHRQIAWDQPIEFLDKELQKITRTPNKAAEPWTSWSVCN